MQTQMKIPARFAVLFTVALALRRAKRGTHPAVQKKPVAPSMSNESGTSAIRDCTCKYALESYQQWPLTAGGGGCVGGCGGTEFQAGHYGGTVKILSVWTTFWGELQAMQITYHDGQVVHVGDPTGAGDPVSITFGPGEYIVGNFRLAGAWGTGAPTTFMAFETSNGQYFEAGNSWTHEGESLFPTGNAYLAGFTGAVGGYIYRLGAIFWKPVSRVEYLDMEYPTLPSLGLGSPELINTRGYCNPTPLTLPTAALGFNRNITTGYEACLTSSIESQFGAGIGVSGGIPMIEVVDGSGEASWGLTASISTTNCETHTETTEKTLTFPSYNIPPETSFDYVFTQWSGTLQHLPFTATTKVTLNDSSTFVRSESGTYSGLAYTNTYEFYDNYMHPVTSCR